MIGLTIGKQSAIIIVLVSEFGRVPNTVIRVFTVSVSTLVLIGTFFISRFPPALCRLKYILLLLQAVPAERSQLCSKLSHPQAEELIIVASE